jgi:PIN domain nuclease of toxin-antitoxin system
MVLGEPGAEIVEAALSGALLCSVNLAEVVSKLREWGMTLAQAGTAVSDLGIEVVEFDETLALMCGDLRVETRKLGLSLGDRACLALARQRGCVALTADVAWARVTDPPVRLLRGVA